MHKIATAAVLAVILVFPISATSIYYADAKLQPSGRPDVSLTISISYVNEERFQAFYSDIGKVDRIFETVILPVMNDFVKKHEKDLNGKYTDYISISYSRETNDISIGFTQYPGGAGETIKIDPQSSVKLEIIDAIHVGFPVGTAFYSSDDDFNMLSALLPNTSVRVGYLSNQMLELIEKYQDVIIKGHFNTISSFMLDDISKTILYFDYQQISEYDTEINLVLDNPVSAYSVPEFSTNIPISIVKSGNYRLTVTCASPDGDVGKMTLGLSYPNGETISVNPTLVHNPAANYRVIEFSLKAEEPEGLYSFVLNDAEPKKLVYCSMNVNRGNDYPFEYVDRSTYSEPTLDRGWQAYEAETWCNYSRLMTVESPDASIVDERTGTSTTVYEWLSEFGEFESTWSNVHFDSTIPTYFLTAVKWRSENLSEIYGAMKAFNSLQPDMKHGRELSMYLITGDCVSAEGREFNVETETSYIIEEMKFSLEEKKISYVVDSSDRTGGLFKVTVPKELLGGNFTLVVDGKPHYVTESVASSVDDTQTVLTYWHEGSAKNIEVIGTEAIPEFPLALIVLGTSIAALTVVFRLYRPLHQYRD